MAAVTGYGNGATPLDPVGGLPMPGPIPVPVRGAAFGRRGRGQAAAAMAEALDLRPRTVARLLRRTAAEGRDKLGVAFTMHKLRVA